MWAFAESRTHSGECVCVGGGLEESGEERESKVFVLCWLG